MLESLSFGYFVYTGRSAAWLARLVRDQEVGGSNPLAPTKNENKQVPISTKTPLKSGVFSFSQSVAIYKNMIKSSTQTYTFAALGT